MDAPLEVELKFLARTDVPLRHLARIASLGPARLGPPAAFGETDRYLDTPGGRLATAGWACRLRTRGTSTIVSLKGPPRHQPGDVMHRRPELEGPAGDLPAGGWPPSPARDLLVELAGGDPLVERLTLAQQRTQRRAEWPGGHGLLTLDEVAVMHRSRRVGRLRVVELEADSAVLVDGELANALAAIPGLEPDPLTKLEHALAMLGAGSR